MKTFLILVLIVVLAGGGLWFWSEQESGASPAPSAAGSEADRRIPVRMAEIRSHRFETVLESLGTAQANESVTITASVTANVAEIGFQDGDEVATGQVLVRLASAEELADQREAQGLLSEQRRELDRIRELAADGLVPSQQVDQQRSRVEEADARLQAVQARLSDRLIQAPFSGVLGLRRVSIGSLVTPGTPVAELDDIAVIKVDFTVSEQYLGAIRRGMPIEAKSVAYRGRSYRGEITAISTRVDVATRTLTVRAEIDNTARELRPGMLLTTRLALDPTERLAVPEGALVATADRQFVFVVSDTGTVQRQEVRVGRRQPGIAEVLDGLTEGDSVVTEGTLRVREGSAVRVLTEERRNTPGDTPA